MRLKLLIATSCLFLAHACAFAGTDYLHLNWVDKKIDPKQNFYEYANGSWQKNHPIPAAYPSWDVFSVLHERNQAEIKKIILDAAADKNPNEIELKVGDFYYSGMDEKTINKLGAKPLAPEFDRINDIKDLADLQTEITHLQDIGLDVLFDFGEMQDFKNSDLVIGSATQGGISLPDREYYLNGSKQYAKIRVAYFQHMIRMFELLGDKPNFAKREAESVFAIETMLAKASMARAEERNPYAIYHIKDINALQQVTPYFNWKKYFSDIGHPEIQQINLGMPAFFKKVNFLLANVSMEDWKAYLRWHLIDSYAVFLSKPFVDENFKIVRLMTGAKNLLPRWKRVVNAESASLGFAIGKLYVEKYFSPASKEKALSMIENIRAALKEDIQHLPWMSEQTRTAALKKLAMMDDRVGYPNKWWDYSSLDINKGPYVLNMVRVSKFLTERELNKIGKPVDKDEWDMTPQTVNAYYDPSMNRLNIPAGILQPPFFDPKAPDAVNYGAIGFVIGHEMTHGFDDEGSKFDGKGNLKNWWTKEDAQKFKLTTGNIAKQFSSYVVAGSHVNGKLVTGEAAADLGGLILAYRALHATPDFKDAQQYDGFTPDQQFFLSAAHVWASNMRLEQMRRLVVTDPHPPALYRVNGTFANMPAFKEAFHIAAKSPMVNNNKISIW